jgi:hypothetical protein
MPENYDDLIQRSAPSTFELFKAQLITESGLDPNATNKESGAKGIAQILDSTWGDIKKMTGIEGSQYDPSKAIPGAAAYMRFLLQRYNFIADDEDRYNTALAAYNWGLGHVDKAITHAAANLDGSTKITYDAIDDYLPDTTTAYVTEINRISKRMDKGNYGDAVFNLVDDAYKMVANKTEAAVSGVIEFDGVLTQFYKRPVLIALYAGVTITTAYAWFLAIKRYKNIGVGSVIGSSIKSSGDMLQSGFKTIKGVIK